MPRTLLEGVEELSAELLQRARVEFGSPMERVANRLGVDVFKHPMPPGVRAIALHEDRSILLSPSGYRPRDEFSIAHELVELHLPGLYARELPSEVKERLCDRGAAALLLPRQQFLCSMWGTGWDLPALRRRWPWASWGAIASRLADVMPSAAASCWVNFERQWQRTSGVLDLGPLFDVENDAVEAAYRRGASQVRRKWVRARAWRLAARGKRVAVVVAAGS